MIAGIMAALLLAATPISSFCQEDGVLLSETDFTYLAIQGIQRDSSVLQKMSPKERYRLHRLISDEKTQDAPQARSDAVRRALAEFAGNQLWEKENPGQFWDAEKNSGRRKLDREQ